MILFKRFCLSWIMIFLSNSILLAQFDPPVAIAGNDRPDRSLGETSFVLSPGGSIRVAFDGSQSFASNSQIVSYEWTDGATSQFGVKVTFTFTTPGTKTIFLIVTDTWGNTSQTSVAITILDGRPCGPVLVSSAVDYVAEIDGGGNQTELTSFLITHGSAIAEDPCEALVWSHDYTPATKWKKGTGSIVESVTVNFKASASSGRFVTTSARFKIVDTAPPPLNWFVDGEAVADYTQISVRKKDLPLAFVVHADDVGSKSTLKKSYKFLAGSGVVSFNGLGKATLKSASAGSTLRVYFQATDHCGNASATEWVEVSILGNNATKYHERCREGLDEDRENDRWERRDASEDFAALGHYHCRD
jgi:PKD domain